MADEILGAASAEFRLGFTKIVGDINRAKGLIRRLVSQIAPVDLRVRANAEQARRSIQNITRNIQGTDVNIQVNLDGMSRINSEVATLQRMVRDQVVTVRVQESGLSQTINGLQDLQRRAVDPHVTARVDVQGSTQAVTELNNVRDAADQAGKKADFMKGAFATALAAITTGGIGTGINAVDKTNTSLDQMRDRITKLSGGKVDTAALDELEKRVRQARINTGTDLGVLADGALNMYQKLGDTKLAGAAVESLDKASKVVGYDTAAVNDVFTEFARNYKNDNPSEVLRTFLTMLYEAPKTKDGLDSLSEYSVKLKEMKLNLNQAGAVFVDVSQNQFNTDKGFDGLKELGISLVDKKAEILAVLGNAVGTSGDQALIKRIQNGALQLKDLSKTEQGELTKFAAGQHMSTESFIGQIQGNNTDSIGKFLGRNNELVQKFLNNQIGAPEFAKQIAPIYDKMSDLQKQKFSTALGSQFEDLGTGGVQKFLDLFANLDVQAEQFKQKGVGIGDSYESGFEKGQTAADKFMVAWRGFINGEGVQKLMDNVRPVLDGLILQIAKIFEWLNKFMTDNPKLTESIFYVVTGAILLGSAIFGLGGVINVVRALFPIFSTGWGVISKLFVGTGENASIMSRIFSFLGGKVKWLGESALWLGRFVLQRVLIPVFGAVFSEAGLVVLAIVSIIAEIAAISLATTVFKEQTMDFLHNIGDSFVSLGKTLGAAVKNIGIEMLQGIMYPITKLSGYSSKLLDMMGLDGTMLDEITKVNAELEKMKVKPTKEMAEWTRNGMNVFKNMIDNPFMDDIKTYGNDVADKYNKDIKDKLMAKLGSIPGIGSWITGDKSADTTGGKDEAAPKDGSSYDIGADLAAEVAKNADAQNKSIEDLIKYLEDNKNPKAEDAGGSGITGNDVKNNPVTQTINNYNPYDIKTVDNNLKAGQNSKSLSVGRRAVPSCGA
jgi:hypothetical protein